MNAYLILLLIAGLPLLISILIDKRRFRNCLYFLFWLFAFALYLVFAASSTKAGPYVAALVILFTMFMVLIVPLLLIINGFTMIKREGRQLSSLLSLLFGIFIFGGEISLMLFTLGNFEQQAPLKITLFIALTVIYISFIFLAFMFYSLLMQVIPHRINFDYIIIHGSGLIHGDQVSKLLQERIDKALKVYHASKTKAKLITSGGRGGDETCSEAAAMKKYILTQGIPEEDILMEDKSTTTLTNLINSKSIINSFDGPKHTAIVTSNYHVLRALIYSREIKLDCTGIGSHVAFYYWPSAMIREFIALMKIYIVPFLSGIILIIVLIEMTGL